MSKKSNLYQLFLIFTIMCTSPFFIACVFLMLVFNQQPSLASSNCKGSQKPLCPLQENDSILHDSTAAIKSWTFKGRLQRRVDYKNSLTIQIPALLMHSFHLSYTRYLYKFIGIGFELGYQPRISKKKTYSNNDFFDVNGPTKEMPFMPFTESRYIGVHTKFYVQQRSILNTFFSLTGFYRNYQYHNATVTWEDAVGGSKGAIREYHDSLNLTQTHQGLKLLIGINPVFAFNEHIALDIEAYAGISIRDISTSLYLFDYYYIGNSYDVNPGKNTIYQNTQVDNLDTKQIAPQVGIKVGIRF